MNCKYCDNQRITGMYLCISHAQQSINQSQKEHFGVKDKVPIEGKKKRRYVPEDELPEDELPKGSPPISSCDKTSCNNKMKDWIINKYWAFDDSIIFDNCSGCPKRGFKAPYSVFKDDSWHSNSSKESAYNMAKIQ